MRSITSILIAGLLCGTAIPAASAAEPVRTVKRTKTVKRHYRKPHETKKTTVDASGALLFLELLGAAAELSQDDEDDDESSYDEAYDMEGWDTEDNFDGEFFVRAGTGLVFQQPVNERLGYSGITSQVGMGIGVAPKDFRSGPRIGMEMGLWLDDYALVDAQAMGVYFTGRAGAPWKVVQPYVGLSAGFLGQFGLEALGPTGSYMDVQVGTDIRIKRFSVGFMSSAGVQLLPGETEDDPSELTGYRQALTINTSYTF
ncbi:MAG: hypothetical protein R3E66_12310 [bacterium]